MSKQSSVQEGGGRTSIGPELADNCTTKNIYNSCDHDEKIEIAEKKLAMLVVIFTPVAIAPSTILSITKCASLNQARS